MKDLLPLGTVFKCAGNYDLAMICGYYGKDTSNNNAKKYICCPYPAGVDFKNVYFADDEDIEKTLFYGYQTNQLIDMRANLIKVKEMLDNNVSDDEISSYIKEQITKYRDKDVEMKRLKGENE